MKKKFIPTIIIFFILSSITFAETINYDSETIPQAASTNNECRDSLAKKFDKLAQKFIKYANEATVKGKIAYAIAYNNCANAELEIAEGFRTGKQNMIDSGRKAYKKAKAKLDLLNKKDASNTPTIKPQYKDIIKKYQNKATYYQNKANNAKEKGNEDLYNIYEKCAIAKNKIADGMIKIVKGNQSIDKLGVQHIKCAKFISLLYANKAIPLKTKVKNLESCIKECHKYAEKAIKESNYELAKKHKKIEAANIIKIEGLKEVASAKKDFKYARKELNKLKRYNCKSIKNNILQAKSAAGK